MKYPVLMYVSIFVQCVVAGMGGFLYKNFPFPLKIFLCNLTFTLIEALTGYTLAIYGINNLWLSHISTIIEFVLMVLIFTFWMKYPHIKSIRIIALFGFSLLWIISKFTFEPFAYIDGWTAAISKILQITFSAFLFIEVIKESDVVWINDSRFWIATGVIIYSAGSLFMYALFNEMLHISSDRLMLVWSLNWVLIIIANLLYARGFLCRK